MTSGTRNSRVRQGVKQKGRGICPNQCSTLPEMKIQDLIWDEAIYPRTSLNRKTVDAYVEALSIGAQFPPVLVQQVVNYTPGVDVSATVMILIDGVHRWHAFRQAGRPGRPRQIHHPV